MEQDSDNEDAPLVARARAKSATAQQASSTSAKGPAKLCVHGVLQRRVSIYWEDKQSWFTGGVDKYDEGIGKIRVTYDDGDCHWYPLDELESMTSANTLRWVAATSAATSTARRDASTPVNPSSPSRKTGTNTKCLATKREDGAERSDDDSADDNIPLSKRVVPAKRGSGNGSRGSGSSQLGKAAILLAEVGSRPVGGKRAASPDSDVEYVKPKKLKPPEVINISDSESDIQSACEDGSASDGMCLCSCINLSTMYMYVCMYVSNFL